MFPNQTENMDVSYPILFVDLDFRKLQILCSCNLEYREVLSDR